MQSNNDDVINLIHEMGLGKNTGDRLVLNPNTGKLERVSNIDENTSNVIQITAEEADMFGASETILVITKEEIARILRECTDGKKETDFKLRLIDDADVFRVDTNGSVTARFYNDANSDSLEKESMDIVFGETEVVVLYNKENGLIKSYWKEKGKNEQLKVIVPPVKEELFSRINGIYETSVLSEKKVAIIGLGSGGSPIALELAKQGVQHFLLIDPDRLETANISRHVCGMSDLGRYKTKAVRDQIKNKNPYSEVKTLEDDITKIAEKENLFYDVDLVICCTDNRESKLIINRFCLEHDLVCIYGGAFRRAYGGQVLRTIPYKTMCYQCFISYMPDLAQDYEISNSRQVERIAYSDTPDVPIEPGLSTDVAPISTFIVKLAILELLKDCQHTMQSLYEDMTESLYFWFNRREKGTQWENVLSPMEFRTDTMSILRWYGVRTQRNEKCPACGAYLRNVEPSEIDLFNS